MLILLNKPFQMLSQFNPNPDYPKHRTLADLDLPLGTFPIGRLDYDSEGLLLLSDNPQQERELLLPSQRHPRSYLVQVAGTPSALSLQQLSDGGLEIRVNKKKHHCAPITATILPSSPSWLWNREPPVDTRAEASSSWLNCTLTEGKNRQVRRMTAKVGHPTLRLVRNTLLHHTLQGLHPGEWRRVD